ncbi:MAG: DUF4924 domain-containing protein [Bacteroidetes bacterium GWD2_45_23]|nr:MAG: DUF4924 domain-containing protein [Bacteroidetes bacterium GWC2_46_850]OFX67485.1 MAG: DUF4924 domain-containing protein [Bacteroidetes bacterium GWC1_47_7]OFX84621.1 MAG: DUF4924 domain-containing protein [Bacteroidetes bacterium GWD2_45_23]HAR38672.1 DUF4924 domain-containing protein [Porphyromonadaceae bacterium]HBB00145.1 DUF4924 domain-containing protein [Porphyromonadaceae bacterium]
MNTPKKRDNIAEYLLYMWQTEDLLRACELDIDKVQQSIINSAYQTTEERDAARDWYEGLIMMMKSEGLRNEGHLQINRNVIIELTDLHLQLLKDPRESEYIALYYNTLPHIVALRARGADKQVPELETCFTALYGYMLLKIRQREISTETQAAVAQITALLRLLSLKYKTIDEENPEI